MSDNRIILTDLKSHLVTNYGNSIKEVILFGSQVRGDSKDYSDYDILIVLKQTIDWRIEREISDLCYEIDLKYGILTDTHIISEDELRMPRGKQPIFINAISKGYHA